MCISLYTYSCTCCMTRQSHPKIAGQFKGGVVSVKKNLKQDTGSGVLMQYSAQKSRKLKQNFD